jgi:hypothetical protein
MSPIAGSIASYVRNLYTIQSDPLWNCKTLGSHAHERGVLCPQPLLILTCKESKQLPVSWPGASPLAILGLSLHGLVLVKPLSSNQIKSKQYKQYTSSRRNDASTSLGTMTTRSMTKLRFVHRAVPIYVHSNPNNYSSTFYTSLRTET